MAFTLVTNDIIIARTAGALFGVGLGSTNLAKFSTLAGTNPDALLNSVYIQSVGTASTASVADVLIANLGITDATAVDIAKNYIVAQLDAVSYTVRGATINTILNQFSQLTSDATYGAAATAWNNKISNAVAYGSQAGNPDTTFDTASGGSTGGNTTLGQTFTLTTSVDNITGTAGDDTINGYVDAAGTTDTLTAADTINGGAGTDTLNIIVDGGAAGSLPGATISNVEVFKIRDVATVASTYNFGTVAGETSVVNNKSTNAVTLNNLATGTTLTIMGDSTTTNGATTFTMAAATDAATITIDGGVTAGNITRNATGAATITVNSTGAANTVGIIDVDTAALVTGLTINATTNLTASLAADYAASSKLTVSGAATTVDLSGAALSANFNKVDASGLTAGGVKVQVNQADTTVDTQFIGGAGNDTLDIGNVVYSSTTLTAAGGAGTDTLKLNDQAALTSTTATYITGFETLSLYDDNDGALDTFDASLLTGITAVSLAADSAADGYSVTNLSATQAAAITISGTQAVAPTFGVTGASTVGQLDTLSIAINDGSSTVNTITLADLNATGVETINFALTDNLTLSGATGLGAFTKIAATGAGALSLTTGALALNVNSTIDASALTGAATINATAATTNGLAIKGSATVASTLTGTAQADSITGGTGNDTISGLAGNDIVTAGAGNDSVTGGAGADTIDVGAGTDTILMTATGQSFAGASITSGTTALTGIDKVTGMAAGDVVDLSGILATFTGSAGSTIAAATGTTVSLVRGNFVDATSIFTADAAGTATLLVYDADGAGAGTAVEAILLVGTAGVTGTAAAGVLTLA